MKNYLQLVFVLSFVFVCSKTAAQNKPEPGILISEFGASYKIINPDYQTSPAQAYKVVFDSTETSQAPLKINTYIHDTITDEALRIAYDH